MKTKLDEAAEQADEADHATSVNKAELKAQGKENSATSEKGAQIIEKREMDALVEQLRKDWANSEFLKLVNDPDFMKELERICEELTGKFRTNPPYLPGVLMQDVIERVVKALPHFRHESQVSSWVYGIARNRMIDVYRASDKKCISMEGTKLQGRNGEEYELDGEETEGGEPANRFVETHRNHVEERRVRSILLDELMGMLSAQERSLCRRYFVEGWTMQEIADADKRTRQAVSNQFGRVMNKLRKHLD